MKKPATFYIVGTLLLAPVLGLIANKVFAQDLTLKLNPPSSSRFSVNANNLLAQTRPRTGGRSDGNGQPVQFGQSAGSGINQFGRYQLVTNSDGRNYIFDTVTGRCWIGSVGSSAWTEQTPKELKNSQ